MLRFPQFLSEVEAWCKVCSEGGLPSEMQELELAIHRHQSLYEQVTQAYTEVQQRHGDKNQMSCSDVCRLHSWRMNYLWVLRWRVCSLEFILTLAVTGCDIIGLLVSSCNAVVQTCCLGMYPHVFADVWRFIFRRTAVVLAHVRLICKQISYSRQSCSNVVGSGSHTGSLLWQPLTLFPVSEGDESISCLVMAILHAFTKVFLMFN